MSSIRSRLTVGFAGALIATMVLFALALLAARRAAVLRELEERVAQEAEQTVTIMENIRQTGATIVMSDSLEGRGLEPRLQQLLELVPEFVVIKDQGGFALYQSHPFQDLTLRDRTLLDDAMREMTRGTPTRLVTLVRSQVMLTTRPLSQTGFGSRPDRVWVGTAADEARFATPEMWTIILVVAPLLLAIALSGAYMIAGRAFRPVDRIIDQVEAISDGRSLHRRLAIGAAGDELSRLSATLNAMIERLETSFGALRRFTADASHELKTPLTVIRADVERSMSPVSTSTEKAVALEEALQQVARMTDLVESLLTLARADEGRFDIHAERIHLSELTHEVVETARLLGEVAGLTIDVPVMEDAEVMGDATRLRQLFLNLVTNAIKYTSRGGRVEIGLTNSGGQVQFSVRDTGIGIAASDLPYIFERFWRADRARSRASERGGFGLGLAICQWIAQAHGGSLTVESRLGRGSRFVAILPVADSLAEQRLISSRLVVEQ